MHKGSCLCGAVTFEVAGELPPADACHCTICRKWTGHFSVGSDVPRSALTVHGMEHVTWYQSSAKARRGFCSKCGSSLFFDPLDHEKVHWIGVTLGALDTPSETKIKFHIFVDNKGDYYEITDGLPQYRQTPREGGPIS